MWGGVIFLPFPVANSVTVGLGWFIVSSALIFLVADGLASSMRWVKQHLPFRSSNKIKLPDELSEITNALEQLASRKIGALIVIERAQSLNAYIKRDMRFDAQIKAGVIISIFHTSSPLHDGAMIISKERIKALRVILPLTNQANVPIGMGTRHRSAIGISERTDAIVLVASEERGVLSVAYRGILVPAANSEMLRHLISTALKGKGFERFKSADSASHRTDHH